jgi:hypothetical protein
MVRGEEPGSFLLLEGPVEEHILERDFLGGVTAAATLDTLRSLNFPAQVRESITIE